jgi:hypothetical protein
MKVSRQTMYNRQRDLDTLRGIIPSECPLLVFADEDGFRVQHLDGDDIVRKVRYQIAHTAIVGFLRAWNAVI